MTTVAFGADHAGYELKQYLIERLSGAGFDIIDHGTHSTESVDYPEFCAAAARSVRDGNADVGIVIGGSGQGEQLAANKVRGARAALCNCLYTTRLARQHNDANVLSLAARYIPDDEQKKIVKAFFETPFEGGRHERRVEKITEIENEDFK
jgi:ribose 5-phosphate isomerase B